jgi:hypothetical protein
MRKIIAITVLIALAGCAGKKTTKAKHAILVVDPSCGQILFQRCEIVDGQVKQCIGMHLEYKCSRVEQK